MTNIRQEWFSNIRSDLLAGLVVALALIPEAIAFSIIAGVDPRVGSLCLVLHCCGYRLCRGAGRE
jgi:MFS superfamily sulfate permease-like transporter